MNNSIMDQIKEELRQKDVVRIKLLESLLNEVEEENYTTFSELRGALISRLELCRKMESEHE